MKDISSPPRRRLICLHEYSTVTSPRFSYKALRILREGLLKVSKQPSRVTSPRYNKTVFTVSAAELMRLNGWLSSSAEMRRISRKLQSFVTRLLLIAVLKKLKRQNRNWWFSTTEKDKNATKRWKLFTEKFTGVCLDWSVCLQTG